MKEGAGPLRRWAAGLLTAALLIAVGTPAFVAHAVPSVAGYLLHPSIFLIQAFPYLLGAVLWIPAWSWSLEVVSVTMSGLLLLGALALYLPVMWRPGAWGGDMIGLAFVVISAATTTVVLAASAGTALWSARKRRREPDPDA